MAYWIRYYPEFSPEENSYLMSCFFDQGVILTLPQQQAYHCARCACHLQVSETWTDYSVRPTMQLAPKVASDLRAWLSSTHQGAGAITEAHIDEYLDEFILRANYRRANTPGRSFACLLFRAVVAPPTRFRPSRSYR
jgi:hypothetical protein